MEHYLPQCLDSVTRNDIPDTLEVIVVNDGSKDKSLEIAKLYHEKRPDIIKIIDKPNGHYGSCINAALKIATGKYFRPLDADDWFDTDALMNLLHSLETTDVDLIITPRTERTETHTHIYQLAIQEKSKNDISVLRNIPFYDLDGVISMHSMTYRLSLLQNIKLQLQEGICYTDTEFYLIPFQYSKNFIYFNLPLYQYRLGREGQSMEIETFRKNRHHLATVLNKIIKKTTPKPGSVEFTRLEGLLVGYFGCSLFDFPLTIVDKQDLANLYHTMQRHSPKLWNQVNKRLFYIPSFCNLTGLNLYFYTKIKNKLGIKNLIFRSQP